MSTESPAHSITVTDVDGVVRVEIDGEIVAETNGARVLREGSLRPRFYLPAADVRAALLERTETHTTCPFKGVASYWSVVLPDGTRHDDVVWSYEEPIESMSAIAGMLAFYDERVTVLVDGRPPEPPSH